MGREHTNVHTSLGASGHMSYTQSSPPCGDSDTHPRSISGKLLEALKETDLATDLAEGSGMDAAVELVQGMDLVKVLVEEKNL